MYPKERREAILEILKRQGFATVEDLMSQLHYSSATINRDLNILQNQYLVKRSYGGVEYGKGDGGIAIPYRYDILKVEKRRIGRAAAELVEDGETIFIDATTTTESMGQYLIEKKNITVITNNISLSVYLSGYGINVIVLGGKFFEKPYFIYSDDTIEMAQKYHADKCFFSVKGITTDGRLMLDYTSLHNVILDNSDKQYLLANRKKFGNNNGKMYLEKNMGDITGVISDYSLDEYKQKYSDIKYITV